MAGDARPVNWEQAVDRARIRVAHTTRLDADAHVGCRRFEQGFVDHLQLALARCLYCTISRLRLRHLGLPRVVSTSRRFDFALDGSSASRCCRTSLPAPVTRSHGRPARGWMTASTSRCATVDAGLT